jgi:hypothetical protein
MTLVEPASSVAPDPLPLDPVPLVAVPLVAVPLVAVPLETVPLETIPLDALPVDAVPLVAVPLETVPLDVLPVDAVPLAEVPLDPVAADIVPVPPFVEPVVVMDEPLVDDWDPVPALPSVGELDPQAQAKVAILPSASLCRCFTFALSLVDGANRRPCTYRPQRRGVNSIRSSWTCAEVLHSRATAVCGTCQ